MNALELVCSSRAWWGAAWQDPWPYAMDANVRHNTSDLPNAPVSIYVMTEDATEAVRLLRLAADRLERNPAALAGLHSEPAPSSDLDDVPF